MKQHRKKYIFLTVTVKSPEKAPAPKIPVKRISLKRGKTTFSYQIPRRRSRSLTMRGKLRIYPKAFPGRKK